MGWGISLDLGAPNVVQRRKQQKATHLLHWLGTLEIFGRGLDIEVDLLLGQIDHVGREQWLPVFFVVGLIGIHHAIQPWKQLLGAVVGVQDHGDLVRGGNGTDVMGTGDGSGNGGLLLVIGDPLSIVSVGCLGWSV